MGRWWNFSSASHRQHSDPPPPASPPPSHIELKRRVQSWWVMVTVFSLSHAAFLLSFNNGAGLLLYLVVLTQLNDVAQFISGKAFGNRKIAPKVSPNKT